MGPKGEMVHTFVNSKSRVDLMLSSLAVELPAGVLCGQMTRLLLSCRVPEVLMEILVLRVWQGPL